MTFNFPKVNLNDHAKFRQLRLSGVGVHKKHIQGISKVFDQTSQACYVEY